MYYEKLVISLPPSWRDLTISPASLASSALAITLAFRSTIRFPQGQVLVPVPSSAYRCLPHLLHLNIRYIQKTRSTQCYTLYTTKKKDQLDRRMAFMVPSCPGLLVTWASPSSVLIIAPLVTIFLLM